MVVLQVVTVGIVGGSDLHKIAEQLGDNCEYPAGDPRNAGVWHLIGLGC